MDLFLFFIKNNIEFLCLSIPLITTAVCFKILKISIKTTSIILLLSLLSNTFFVLKYGKFDLNSIEHFFPYLASFLWLFAEYLLEKSKEKETNEIIDKEEARKYLVTSIQVNRKITDIENISTFLKQGSSTLAN